MNESLHMILLQVKLKSIFRNEFIWKTKVSVLVDYKYSILEHKSQTRPAENFEWTSLPVVSENQSMITLKGNSIDNDKLLR